jgi:CBS domain-containing protein
VELLVAGGARTELITALTTQTADAIIRSLAASIEAELGPPPVAYALIVLGSEGRAEQTLLTDQDNAILFADSQAVPQEKSRAYLLDFGRRLNRLLARSGYALCRGEVMAGNPTWNQPLAVWKRYFGEWIRTPDPQNLLEISTFFDLRPVWGDQGLAAELGDYIHGTLRETPAFFGHLARVCLTYKVPLGLFGKIQTEADDDAAHRLNIKNPIRVIVNLVRLYAMAHGIRASNTLERVDGLAARAVFPRSLQRDIRFAFDFLMTRQFQAQLQAYRHARPLDHFLDLASISLIERETLKAIFSQIGDFQARLKHDFSLSE